jgi:hypothetical protein
VVGKTSSATVTPVVLTLTATGVAATVAPATQGTASAYDPPYPKAQAGSATAPTASPGSTTASYAGANTVSASTASDRVLTGPSARGV